MKKLFVLAAMAAAAVVMTGCTSTVHTSDSARLPHTRQSFQSNSQLHITTGTIVTQDTGLPSGTSELARKGRTKATGKTGIPGLMNIPYVGQLFYSENDM